MNCTSLILHPQFARRTTIWVISIVFQDMLYVWTSTLRNPHEHHLQPPVPRWMWLWTWTWNVTLSSTYRWGVNGDLIPSGIKSPLWHLYVFPQHASELNPALDSKALGCMQVLWSRVGCSNPALHQSVNQYQIPGDLGPRTPNHACRGIESLSQWHSSL